MLVAYGPSGQPVVAEEAPLEQLQQWSHEQALHCPNCRSAVHVRGGPGKHTQLHFAHMRGECAWSTESESVRHMRGKMVLAQWLREQFPMATVTLEERLPGPNRIADIFVNHADGRQQAVEFQCAPLDLEEWQHRHVAYRDAHIIDTWIIGNNRREKQEAFIEAILLDAREVLFLDPLLTPPRTWLRWPVTRETVSTWQAGADAGSSVNRKPSLEGWVGRLGYGATLVGQLREIHLGEQGGLRHEARAALETRTQLIRAMQQADQPDAVTLEAYLRPALDAAAVRGVMLPLLRAYLRDPDLLRRYNYGRGQWNQPPTEEDKQRVQNARAWIDRLAQRGFPPERLQELARAIPPIGSYAALASYFETLLTIR